MQGDFSRDSFDLRRVFSRVLNQQGRVLLDSDWNEMQSIQLHFLRTLAADLIGPHGGAGFAIGSLPGKDFSISKGHYYVDGLLCENDKVVAYAGGGGADSPPPQPFWAASRAPLEDRRYLVYLDVWERHLAWPETDGPIEIERRTPAALRDVALSGMDTASRAQLIWQVRIIRRVTLPGDVEVELPANAWNVDEWRTWLGGNWDLWKAYLQPESRGLLTAQTTDPSGAESKMPCAVPPQARYRGVENQLYRVEIHQGGKAGDGASFKWSRENGSVVLPIHAISGTKVELSAWWRDGRLGLAEGDWVEVLDDVAAWHQLARPLRRIKKIDQDSMTVYLDATPVVTTDDPTRHPILRRWDHRADKPPGGMTEEGILIEEDRPYDLESGIRIAFSSNKPATQRYRTGDHWLIPARTAIADVIWPRNEKGEPEARPPTGVEHHYAPLAIVEIAGAPPISLRYEIRRVAG